MRFFTLAGRTRRGSSPTMPGRNRGNAPDCSPRAWWRPRKAAGSRCFSAAASTPAKTFRTCSPNGIKSCPAPIQMCDALTRNLPAELKTIVAHCLAHGRRQFVEVAERFPDECRHVLESLSVVYRNDAIAREQNLSPAAASAFPPGRKRPDDGGASCLAETAVRRAARGAELSAGRGRSRTC